MASTVYNATLKNQIYVKVECEGCGNVFEYISILEASGGSSTTGSHEHRRLEATRNAQKELDKKIGKIKNYDFSLLNMYECPKCGYKQSFMVRGKQQEELKQAAIGFCMAVISIVIISTNIDTLFPFTSFYSGVGTIFLICIGIVGLILLPTSLFSAIRNPNKKWLEMAKNNNVWKKTSIEKKPIEIKIL